MHFMRAATAAVFLVAAGCGDDNNGSDEGVTPDAPPTVPDSPTPLACAPLVTPELPEVGSPLGNPAEFLLTGCVPGGLENLPGRWWTRVPDAQFDFEYPAFAGTCDDGFRRVGLGEEDHDASDGYTLYTWNDGTRFYYRQLYQFDFNGQVFDFAFATAACLQADGTLAAKLAQYDSDRGASSVSMIGTRVAQHGSLAEGLALVGEVGQRADGSYISAYNLVVDSDLAYVVGPSGMEIIDITDPAAPTLVSSADGQWNDIKLAKGAGRTVVFTSPIGNDDTGVFDVTDPAMPLRLADIPEYSHSVFVRTTETNQTLLYLATYTNDVPVYDVSTPTVPRRLGAATLPGPEAGIHDLFVDGTKIYANNTTAGLVAIDVAAGLDSPTLLGQTDAPYSHASWAATVGGRAVVLHGDEGMTGTAEGGAYLRVLDATPGPTFLADIGKYQTRPEIGIHNIIVEGDTAYVAYYQDGIRVVDLSNPTQPTEVAHYNTWDFENGYGQAFEGAVGLRHRGNLIYVADYNRGLIILRETK